MARFVILEIFGGNTILAGETRSRGDTACSGDCYFEVMGCSAEHALGFGVYLVKWSSEVGSSYIREIVSIM